jgi:cell division protein FtsQ
MTKDVCMDDFAGRVKYTGFLLFLMGCALLLAGRLVYLYLSDFNRFPISTIKIVASYEHITRKQLESVLSRYRDDSFITIPVSQLEAELGALTWASRVSIERIWPDTLKIVLKEQEPVAIWNHKLMTADGDLITPDSMLSDGALPKLGGPAEQQRDVLQEYQKLSQLLSSYGLSAASLTLHDNQAWDLGLANGVQLRLGKRDLKKRVLRFCQAYPAVFAEKSEQLSSVDLRYARGMAVQWKEPVNNIAGR